MTARLGCQIKALVSLGRTRGGVQLIKNHAVALAGLMFDPWSGFTPRPPTIIQMHLRPEDLQQ